MGKAKMVILAASIPLDKVMPDDSTHRLGHTFRLLATLKVEKRTRGMLSGEGIDYPELEWKEKIDWFDRPGANWEYRGREEQDMYTKNPGSNTFRAWPKRYVMASDPTNRPPQGLTDAVKKAGQDAVEVEKACKHWIAEHGFEWTIGIDDMPMLGRNPSATSGGGGGTSLVTSTTRRRVIYFDLGFRGSPVRATATQVLETVNGRTSILHFVTPAISKAEADNPANLERWRREHR